MQIPAWIMYLSACFYSQGYAKYMQRKYALCWQIIRPPLGLVMCLEGTACSCPYRYGLLQRRSQSKVSGGKRHTGPNSEGARPGLQQSSPGESVQGVRHSSSNMWNVCQGSLLETRGPEFLLGSCPVALSTLHLPNSRVPEAKQVFSINRPFGLLK